MIELVDILSGEKFIVRRVPVHVWLPGRSTPATAAAEPGRVDRRHDHGERRRRDLERWLVGLSE